MRDVMLTKLIKSAIIKYINHNQTKMGVTVDTGFKINGIFDVVGLANVKAVGGKVDVMLDLASIIKLMEKKDDKQSIINIRFT